MSLFKFPGYQLIVKNKKTKAGGGLAFLVKEHLVANVREDYSVKISVYGLIKLSPNIVIGRHRYYRRQIIALQCEFMLFTCIKKLILQEMNT